ncbi:hypothetical protein F2Q70_00029795 [Brassica cretica]|uniref:Replication factor A C-terminal domain-containing protein n=1 Tax=Brassica cretica TaxID=69181 RepID=A0A8S9FL27_BRACR|nr:hypothetical protein F2Q70_00029795 [Brassica cretica]
MDKGWCYVSFSRYRMQMSIADDTDEGLFVAFDGEMKKLHNMHTYEAGHLMAGEGVNVEETQPPPFIADIVGKTYRFQVRVDMNNFTANHQTFTISRMNKRVTDGDDDDGEDLPGNTSSLPNVGIEGNERVETSSAGTSSSGPATKKPLLSTSGQEGTESLSEHDGVSRPPDHLSSDLLHYADDPPGPARFQPHPELEL